MFNHYKVPGVTPAAVKTDRRELLRRSAFNSAVFTFITILLVLLSIFIMILPAEVYGTSICLPGAQNVVNEPGPGEIPIVSIKRDGTIFVGSDEVPGLSQMNEYIKRECLRLWCKKEKVLFRADRETSFARVREALKALSAAHVRVVGLLAISQNFSVDN